MALFRKRPVVVEARQLPSAGTLAAEAADYAATLLLRSIREWCGGFTPQTLGEHGRIAIQTLEGVMVAEPGDWIIKGVKSEFYPCKADIFAATYDTACACEGRYMGAGATHALNGCQEN